MSMLQSETYTFFVYDYASEEDAYDQAIRAAFDFGLQVYDVLDASGVFVGYEAR